MTTNDVATNLAVLQRTLTVQVPLGTFPETYQAVPVHAYNAPPRNSVPSGDLPCFINIPMASGWRQLGSDEAASAYDDTTWDLKLLVAHSMDDTPEEIGALCFPFFDPVVDLLVAHTNLAGVRGVIRTYYLGNGGIQNIAQAGEKYIGIVFRLQTSEWRVIPYASDE